MELCDWLAKYNCSKVCMEFTGKYWIPVFDVLEKANLSVILSHPNTQNRKLDNVFSDVFGKFSRSITEYILAHSGEPFDATPFVDGRCETPIEEIQAAVDRICTVPGFDKNPMTAIWHILSDLKPYIHRMVFVTHVL